MEYHYSVFIASSVTKLADMYKGKPTFGLSFFPKDSDIESIGSTFEAHDTTQIGHLLFSFPAKTHF